MKAATDTIVSGVNIKKGSNKEESTLVPKNVIISTFSTFSYVIKYWYICDRQVSADGVRLYLQNSHHYHITKCMVLKLYSM